MYIYPQRGASRVYGVDVGYGQVHERVRTDPRVVVMERTNVRHLRGGDLPEPVHLVTLDLSFISVLKVMPAVHELLDPERGQMLVLIKPQFEAGKEHIKAGGVVRDPAVHQEVIGRVTAGICAYGMRLAGVTESPIKGDKSGNTEFLAHLLRDPSVPVTAPPRDAPRGTRGGAEDDEEEDRDEQQV
jgi:23S rRNA (cytidine1920-2'-O)/16S rRNA (cytidine1409-2'-O)-methyltransferase